MGVGKSSVGKTLAQKLSKHLIDIDKDIEIYANRKISEIFESQGEPAFRVIEKEVVCCAAQNTNCVIVTGGGVVLDEANMQALRQNGIIVSLSASALTIYHRVKNSTHRPLLKSPDVLGEIQKILTARKALYEKADLLLDTDGQTPTQVSDQIIDFLKSHGNI